MVHFVLVSCKTTTGNDCNCVDSSSTQRTFKLQFIRRTQLEWAIIASVTSLANVADVGRGGEIRDTKTLNLWRNIVSLLVLVDVSRFSPCLTNLSGKKNLCWGLKKVVALSRARVYFVQQILALLLVFHQTHNWACNKFARALANHTIRALHFFDLQQMFLSRITLIMQGEKRETSTKTYNETMLRDKLRVFISRISPP